MSEKTPTTEETTTVVEEPKRNFVQRVVDAGKTKTGKAVLIGVGSAVALVATYVTGFRNGSDESVCISLEVDDETGQETLLITDLETEDSEEEETEDTEDTEEE